MSLEMGMARRPKEITNARLRGLDYPPMLASPKSLRITSAFMILVKMTRWILLLIDKKLKEMLDNASES